jgi:hypothetical protein
LLSRLAGALRQASARPKRETRFFFRRARSDLQRLVGDAERNYLILNFRRGVRHGIGPLVAVFNAVIISMATIATIVNSCDCLLIRAANYAWADARLPSRS